MQCAIKTGTEFLGVYSWTATSHDERFDMLLNLFWCSGPLRLVATALTMPPRFFLAFHAVGCLATVFLDWFAAARRRGVACAA